MPAMSSRGRVGFDFSFSTGKPAVPAVRDGKLRILVVADFAGSALPAFSVRKVNLDDLDELVKAFCPQVTVQASGGNDPVTLSFQCMDDFHPDEIGKRVAWFAQLERTRRELNDPATFAAAAAKLSRPSSEGASAVAADDAAPSSLFASLLGGKVASPGLDDMIARAIAPHVVPARDPQQGVFVADVEATMADRMRDILHAPAFQTLEAAWRGLARLVATFPSDAGVQVWVAAAPPVALLADVARNGGHLEESLVGNLICGASAPAWSLVILDHVFGNDADDLMGLGAFGAAAGRVGASVVAGGAAALHEGEDASLMETWALLRESPLASAIALVHPALLLRLPYGPRRNEVHSFAFDELGSNKQPSAQRLLWGTGAWAVAEALAKAFAEDPSDLPLGSKADVDDMPTLTFVDADGERQLYPFAQTWLNETQAQALVANGVIPLVGHRTLARATLLRLQSIDASPMQVRTVGRDEQG